MSKEENKLYDLYVFYWVDHKGNYSHATVSGESLREAFGFLEKKLREKGCNHNINKSEMIIKRPDHKSNEKGVIEGLSYYNEVHF
jgi:hypothetical protein